MSNEETGLVPGGLPPDLSPEMAAELTELMQTAEELGGDLLSMLGIYSADRDRWKTGDTKKDEVVGILLHSVPTLRTFWPPDAPMGQDPPTCFSIDGEKPSPTVREAQAESCAGCPWDAFGTAREGEGKACKTKRCDFLIEVDTTSLGPPDKEGRYALRPENIVGVALIRASATARPTRASVAQWAKEVRRLVRGIPQLVLTRWGFDETKSKGGVAFYAPTLEVFGPYTTTSEALVEVVNLAKDLRGGKAAEVLTTLAGRADPEPATN